MATTPAAGDALLEAPSPAVPAQAPLAIGVTGLRGIPQVMGGIESHCGELYPRLARLRPADDFVVTARKPYMPGGAHDYQGLHIVPVFAVRNKYLEALVSTFVAVLVLRFRFRRDVVHIHGIGPALLAPLSRLLGMDTIVTHHGEDYNRAKWNAFARNILRLGEWLAVVSATQLIVVSRGVAENLQKRYPKHRARIHFIPNGVTILSRGSAAQAAAPEILADLGLTSGGYILAVGRLVPEKGFADLIAAFLASGSSRKLVIAGKADHEDDYARGLLAQASDRVIFAGFQTHDRLAGLYAHASLFVLPSYHEGLPIAALEAAGMGCNILLSDILPNVEIGLAETNYFPVGNVPALAAKLAADGTDYAIDSADILNRFDWDTVAAQTSALFARSAGDASKAR